MSQFLADFNVLSSATELAVNGLVYIGRGYALDVVQITVSGYILTMTGLGISLTVNATVTGLIVLRILKVYNEVKPTFGHRTLGNGGPAEAKL